MQTISAVQMNLIFFLQLVLRGYGLTVFNRVMQPGDYFLRNGCPHIALGFYREAIFLFPGNAICHIREGQSLIAMVSIDDLIKAPFTRYSILILNTQHQI